MGRETITEAMIRRAGLLSGPSQGVSSFELSEWLEHAHLFANSFSPVTAAKKM
jgi:hypothetical protein